MFIRPQDNSSKSQLIFRKFGHSAGNIICRSKFEDKLANVTEKLAEVFFFLVSEHITRVNFLRS